MSFEEKKLEPQKRVCARLKESREAKHIPLADISRRTRISKKYLEALEECRFEHIPFSEIYQKNFVKSYALALGMPPEPFLIQFMEEEFPEKNPQHHRTPLPRAGGRGYFSNLPRTIRLAIMLTSVCVLVGYLAFQVVKSIEPPTLTLSSPPNGSVASSQHITVRGTTEREASITVNGVEVRTDTNGQFTNDLYLTPGVNTITVTARKKHGKSTTEIRHVILKEPTVVSIK